MPGLWLAGPDAGGDVDAQDVMADDGGGGMNVDLIMLFFLFYIAIMVTVLYWRLTRLP